MLFQPPTLKLVGFQLTRNSQSKYEGTLICKGEIELMQKPAGSFEGFLLGFCGFREVCSADAIFRVFRDGSVFAFAAHAFNDFAKDEASDGLLHHIISETHQGFDSVKQAYECMGRSMTKRTTLLTIPHSPKGYGSKRAARGRIYFNETKLEGVNVKYKDTLLYPNAMDENDVSVAKCEDNFTVPPEKLSSYNYSETPSSPQFFLYSLGSPEDAALWHGVGAFGAPQLLQSYTSVRNVCRSGQLIRNLKEKYGARVEVPLHLNLAPDGVWVHPVHRNIDASIGCVENLGDLARMGMKIEYLSNFK